MAFCCWSYHDDARPPPYYSQEKDSLEGFIISTTNEKPSIQEVDKHEELLRQYQQVTNYHPNGYHGNDVKPPLTRYHGNGVTPSVVDKRGNDGILMNGHAGRVKDEVIKVRLLSFL